MYGLQQGRSGGALPVREGSQVVLKKFGLPIAFGEFVK
jgi:hypothetical protein